VLGKKSFNHGRDTDPVISDEISAMASTVLLTPKYDFDCLQSARLASRRERKPAPPRKASSNFTEMAAEVLERQYEIACSSGRQA
jgi:hypothetical protein